MALNKEQRNILHRMVCEKVYEITQKIERKLDALANKNYYFQKHCLDSDESVKRLPRKDQTKLKKIREKIESLSGQKKQLEDEMEQIFNKLTEIDAPMVAELEKAKSNLKKASEEAHFSITFATNADSAKSLLESIPSMEDLLK